MVDSDTWRHPIDLLAEEFVQRFRRDEYPSITEYTDRHPDLAAEIRAVVSTGAQTQTHAAYEFPRCSFYCGRWIRHGDWYPDHVRRLWRRGLAVWKGEEPHADLEVQGTIGRLRSDLLHHSNESITRQISKIAPYQSGAVQRWLNNGAAVGPFELALRPLWRFLRAYFFRLGILDGWQGFYIAALTSFSTLTRYAMVREARVGDSASEKRRC